jgi:hypothetical protein
VPLLLDGIHEIASVAILIHEVVVILGLEMVLVFDNEFAGADGGEGFDFIDCALFEQAIILKLLGGDDFYCEFSLLLDVEGAVDVPEIALPDLLN